MSRGFDGLEIDDFQGPERGVNRSPESNSRAGWDTVRRLERIRGEEERADQRDQEARGTSGGNRPLYLARIGSNLSSLEPAARTTWTATGPTNYAIPSCTP
jgi:hypothetical protein